MDLRPETWQVAILHGYDISIRPLANIFRSEGHSVYGIVTPPLIGSWSAFTTMLDTSLAANTLPEAVMEGTTEGHGNLPCATFLMTCNLHPPTLRMLIK